jgi:ferredoxin
MEQAVEVSRPAEAPAPAVWFTVTIVETGETFRCNSRDSVLENLRRTGRRGIPVGCRAGGCSVCKIEIVSGDYEVYRPMSREFVSEDDIREGRILACCVHARSDLSVRVIGRLQKAIQKHCQNSMAEKTAAPGA